MDSVLGGCTAVEDPYTVALTRRSTVVGPGSCFKISIDSWLAIPRFTALFLSLMFIRRCASSRAGSTLYACRKAIKEYKIKWARRKKVDIRVLNEWEGTVNSIVEERITRLRNKHKHSRRQYRKQVLKDKSHLKYLQDLHEEFVLVPADKASNNVLVVCMKYYLDVVIKELSSKDTNGPKTYEECSDNVDVIVKQHLLYMSSNNIKIPEVMTQLPAFYWLPKMHKTPTGSRFIAASSSCTTKPLSQLLTNCLNLIIQHFKEYNEGILKNSGANCFWIINNSTQVLNNL